MSLGLIGRKAGMTRIFSESGDSMPVTVVDVSKNRIAQIKTNAVDGYSAVQVAFGERRSTRVNKPAAGHFSKAGIEAGQVLKEFRLSEEDSTQYKVGEVINSGMFSEGQKIDVSGYSIGKGYAGTVKRHNFSSNRASHGNSKAHRKPGSTGMAQDPGRVFPGKRMSGHLGNEKCTTQNLEIVKIDNERNLLLIKGSIPGSKGSNVVINHSVKNANSEVDISKKVNK